MRKAGGYSEAEGDDGETVEVNEEENSEEVGVVDDGAFVCRYEEYSGDEDASDG